MMLGPLPRERRMPFLQPARIARHLTRISGSRRRIWRVERILVDSEWADGHARISHDGTVVIS